MCESLDHSARGLSRRNFAALAVAGGAVSLLGLGARAAESKAEPKPLAALAITCIDYRYISHEVNWLDTKVGLKQYDLTALAGASLASVSQMFPASVDALWNHINIARTLHAVKKVMVFDHHDCGAFKQEFGPNYAGEGTAELNQHVGVMKRMKAEFIGRGWSDLGVGLEFYFFSSENNPPTALNI